MEGGAEPSLEDPQPFSCGEAGQTDERLEWGRAPAVRSPEAGGGLPGGLRAPAQPGPHREGDPASLATLT